MVELPLNAHLLFFRSPELDAGEGALDEEGGEFLAADLGKDGKEIGFAAVSDPHLLPVQDVMLTIGRKVGAGLRGERESEPACGSVRQSAATSSALESRGRYFAFWASVPKSNSGMVPMPACAPCQPE